MFQQFYFYQFSLAFVINVLLWFHVLLCIFNNSIIYQSFVYKQLNDQTVVFQTSQFDTCNLFNLDEMLHS